MQTTQQGGNVRWNRLFHNVAVQLPNVIADANPDGTGNPGVGIISAYRPFGKSI
jgi:hypothetical protein